MYKAKSNCIKDGSPIEPIVSRDEFDRAQAALKEDKERDVLAGTKTKIRCGVCGHAMERHNTKQPYYDCRTLRVTDKFPCPPEKIPEQEIHAALLDSLRSMAQMAVDMDKLLREQQKEQMQDVAAMHRTLSGLQEQVSQLKQQTKSQYEAFVMGEIGKEEYLALKRHHGRKRKLCPRKSQSWNCLWSKFNWLTETRMDLWSSYSLIWK